MLAAALLGKKDSRKKSGFTPETNRTYLMSSHSISPVSQDSRSASPNNDYPQMNRNARSNDYNRNMANFYHGDDLVNRSTEELNPKDTPKNMSSGRKLPPIGQPRKEQPKLPAVAIKNNQATNSEDMKQKILNSYLSKYKTENDDAINMNVFKIGSNHVNNVSERVRPMIPQANHQQQAPSHGKRLPQINQVRPHGGDLVRPQIPVRGNNVNYGNQSVGNKHDSVIMFSSQHGAETRTLTENNSDSDGSDNWI